MPTHLLLEGEDIESVLTRLREEHGDDAKIVQAELVRVGGIGGFFAKRRYEVTVEVDGPDFAADLAPDLAAGLAPTSGSADLLAGAPLDPLTDPWPASTRGSTPASAPVAAATLSTAVSPATLSAAPASAADFFAPQRFSGIDELLSAAADQDHAELGGHRVPPFVAHIPAQQGWHRPVSTEAASFADILGPLTDELAEPAHLAVPTEVIEPDRSAVSTEAHDPQPAFTPQWFIPTPKVEPVAEDLASTRRRLADLGVPEQLLASVGAAEPVLALRDIVAAMPPAALPTWRPSATRGGALVVVVGSWADSRATVQGLVDELGVEPEAVLAAATSAGHDLAGAVSVRSHATAVGLVIEGRRIHDVSILVIDPGLTRHSAARVAATVHALEAQSVIVTGDATSDLRTSLLALDALDQAGVQVDALGLVGVARAARPAAALEIPVPVSWIDGRLATEGQWIGTLLDALSDRGASASC